MNGTFSIRIDGASELNKVLIQLEGRAASLDRVLPTVAEMLVSAVDDVFEAQGPGWKELSPVTLALRRKHGRGAKILQDTGAAARSIGPNWGADYAEAVAGVDYLIYHNGEFGLPRRWPFDLGPFEAGVLDDVADLLTRNFL